MTPLTRSTKGKEIIGESVPTGFLSVNAKLPPPGNPGGTKYMGLGGRGVSRKGVSRRGPGVMDNQREL